MEEQVFGGETTASVEKRSLFASMKRGFMCRCPNCGKGKLFRAFLKSADNCSECGEEFYHHRADDLPAYLVIVIVGHIVVGAFVGIEMYYYWPAWLHLTLWVPITIIMALALLNPVKGATIGLQWALHMHGFGGEPDQLDSIEEA